MFSPSVWCGIPATAHPFSLAVQYHLLKINPPALPRIVAAVAVLGRLGEGLVRAADRCPSSAYLPLPSCTHSSSMLGVTYCQHTRFVPMSSLLYFGQVGFPVGVGVLAHYSFVSLNICSWFYCRSLNICSSIVSGTFVPFLTIQVPAHSVLISVSEHFFIRGNRSPSIDDQDFRQQTFSFYLTCWLKSNFV